jgi:hypothetical protein
MNVEKKSLQQRDLKKIEVGNAYLIHRTHKVLPQVGKHCGVRSCGRFLLTFATFVGAYYPELWNVISRMASGLSSSPPPPCTLSRSGGVIRWCGPRGNILSCCFYINPCVILRIERFPSPHHNAKTCNANKRYQSRHTLMP